MIKVATVCSGIGSPEQALKNLNIPHEISFACEIDKFARQTYLANFNPNKIFEDMTKETWEGEQFNSDLFIGGIPCQAFSLAGKRLGELDPRGLLFYDFYRYVKAQQPKYFIIENVKGLLSDDNGKTFRNWIQLLGRSENTHVNMFNHPDSLEYNLHWKVLNSKDFEVPQNRERVFIVGVRKDLPNTFRFPPGWWLDIRLKDVLEDNVDEKYYLSDESISSLIEHKKRNDEAGNGFGVTFPDLNGVSKTIKIGGGGKDDLIKEPIIKKFGDLSGEAWERQHESSRRVFSSEGICPTIPTASGGGHHIKISEDVISRTIIKIKEATKQGYAIAKQGDSINLSNPNSETRRGRVGAQIANTLDTACNQAVVEQGYRIRRLTPLECFRLQGFPDSFIKPCSDSQTYKQAGNTITVSVIQAIIKNLLV